MCIRYVLWSVGNGPHETYKRHKGGGVTAATHRGEAAAAQDPEG